MRYILNNKCMASVKLSAVARSEEKTPAELRREGMIPGVVYGKKVKPYSVAVEEIPFNKVLKKAGESTLVDFAFADNESVNVLIQDVQRHAVREDVMHVDFYQVDMKEKITANIPLEFVGEALAVDDLGGLLVKTIDTLSVQCLPGDLVHEIKVDISVLKTFEDSLRIKDIQLPEGLEISIDPEASVVSVEEPKSEEELDAELAEAVSEEDAIAGIEDVEGEEGEEGEAAEGEEGAPVEAKEGGEAAEGAGDAAEKKE